MLPTKNKWFTRVWRWRCISVSMIHVTSQLSQPCFLCMRHKTDTRSGRDTERERQRWWIDKVRKVRHGGAGLQTVTSQIQSFGRESYSFRWRTEGGVGGCSNHPPPPKFRRPSKIVPNSTRLRKMLTIAGFRTPSHQDVRKKGSKILKLPRFAIVLH